MARDGTDVRPVTKLNAANVAAAQMGEFEQFRFTGAKGDTVHGYLVKPVGFTAGERYPVAFLIHGGPQGIRQPLPLPLESPGLRGRGLCASS